MGLAASSKKSCTHDFFELAANPTVYLTRSKRSESGPTIASRWIWRLKTLLRGAVGEEEAKQLLKSDHPYLDWARALDQAVISEVNPAKKPMPRPDTQHRWSTSKGRSLSITEVKTLIRDPYSIYGKHVLRLRKLRDLSLIHISEPTRPY